MNVCVQQRNLTAASDSERKGRFPLQAHLLFTHAQETKLLSLLFELNNLVFVVFVFVLVFVPTGKNIE